MSEKILSGYLLKGSNHLDDIEMILYEARQRILPIANKMYENLVIKQVERIVDEISLNLYSRPKQKSILEIATEETQRRILYADQHMHMIEYNFHISTQIMLGNFDGTPSTIFKINTLNNMYEKSLNKVKEWVPFNFYDTDLESKSEKSRLWNSLSEKYTEEIPFSFNLLPYDQLKIVPENFHYRSVMERAEEKAQEKILNHLLACYSCNEQIQPHKLMEFVLQAMKQYTNQQVQKKYLLERDKLLQILPEITYEMIIQKESTTKGTE